MNHFKWISILNMNVANAKQQHNNTNTRKKRKMHIYTIRFCMRSNKGEKKNNGNINYIPDIVKFVTLSARHLTNKHKTILLQLFFFLLRSFVAPITQTFALQFRWHFSFRIWFIG